MMFFVDSFFRKSSRHIRSSLVDLEGSSPVWPFQLLYKPCGQLASVLCPRQKLRARKSSTNKILDAMFPSKKKVIDIYITVTTVCFFCSGFISIFQCTQQWVRNWYPERRLLAKASVKPLFHWSKKPHIHPLTWHLSERIDLARQRRERERVPQFSEKSWRPAWRTKKNK